MAQRTADCAKHSKMPSTVNGMVGDAAGFANLAGARKGWQLDIIS